MSIAPTARICQRSDYWYNLPMATLIRAIITIAIFALLFTFVVGTTVLFLPVLILMGLLTVLFSKKVSFTVLQKSDRSIRSREQWSEEQFQKISGSKRDIELSKDDYTRSN